MLQKRRCLVRFPCLRKLLPQGHEKLAHYSAGLFLIAMPSVHLFFQVSLSCASWYHSVIFVALRSATMQSLHLFQVPCCGLVFSNLPNSSCLGNLSGPIQARCPSHLSLWAISMSSIVSTIPNVITSSVEEMCSVHWLNLFTPRMIRMQRLWNAVRRLTSGVLVIHVSAPYKSVGSTTEQ